MTKEQTTAQASVDLGKINFMKVRTPAVILSLVLIIGSLVGLWYKGLNLGVDFTGGTIIELSYPNGAELNTLRNQLVEAGYEQAQVQHFGSSREVLIRIAPRDDMASATLSNEVMASLRAASDEIFELRRVEFVGPQVGEELTSDGALAVLYALIGILIYVALRFEFRFSLGAIAALVHDVVITVGVFAWTQIQFDLTVLAALLAIIGYSLNDTIVVFDRVRENFRTVREGSPSEVTNKALNDMLSRTLMTSLTTLMVLVALFFLGGEIIHGFATALIIGVIVGTYSSVYVASNVALMLGVSKQDLMPPVKADDNSEEKEDELQRAFLEAEAKRKLQD
ncbi:MAG: protein translocase subunit SecF [Thiomicrospira sp.]|uniref:protein translocase subunit SecF n=1 Tax=Thiomicrospira sp. TaxID=935 RepID=UPI0019E8091B|nr:protein translocase subunit SecF [Thiomicrospira sp.]MBE0494224.1 protein translocase subunit SecF [Thiomicrospira sp.]